MYGGHGREACMDEHQEICMNSYNDCILECKQFIMTALILHVNSQYDWKPCVLYMSFVISLHAVITEVLNAKKKSLLNRLYNKSLIILSML